MVTDKNTREALLSHLASYPRLELRDLLKFIHQSAFGCEHIISSPEAVTDYIRREADSLPPSASAITEPLCGAYSRVHLDWLSHGLSAETLGRLLYMSAVSEPDGISRVREMLDTAKAMTVEGSLPFDTVRFTAIREKWESDGFPALHHSDSFRSLYRPAYRVISSAFTPFLPLLARLDSMLKCGAVTLAIEGGSACGKTTLGGLLEKLYGCTVFHMDDFFLRPEQRTPERFAEPGGNVDRERFLEEVLLPLSEGKAVTYRPFDCSSFALADPITVSPTPLTVIEGAYSMHPELAGHYDLSVFLEVSPELQRKRIGHRNSPAMAKRFFEEWIPLEHLYFSDLNVKDRCDMVISVP